MATLRPITFITFNTALKISSIKVNVKIKISADHFGIIKGESPSAGKNAFSPDLSAQEKPVLY
ncbi:hypothetical protein [Duffyella gerundensis]|uniref:hypothetical protein n=1 Tax=Duffyella TaxID=3026546 RepID=UPI003F6E2D27